MNKYYLVFALIIFSILQGFSQVNNNGIIKGVIIDNQSGDPLIGVSVSVKGTSKGSTTDQQGNFIILNLPAGKYDLIFSFIGFSKVKMTGIEVVSNKIADLGRIQMQESGITLKEIIVTPGQFSIMGNAPLSRQTLKSEDIRNMSFAEDITRAIVRLPGVASNDYSSKFTVRGGEDNEVLITLDGMELYEPFHPRDYAGGLLSIVDAETIQGIDLITGGFSAEYGNRESGVFNMQTKQAPDDEKSYAIGLTNMYARFYADGRFAKNRANYLFSARRNMLDQSLKVIDEEESTPKFYDMMTKIEYEINPNHSLAIYGLHAGDKTKIRDIEPGVAFEIHDTKYFNSYGWLTWKASFSPKLFARTLLFTGFISHDRNASTCKDEYSDKLQFQLKDKRTYEFFGIKQDWNWDISERFIMKTGFELKQLNGDYDYDYNLLDVRINSMDSLISLSNGVTVNTKPEGQQTSAYISGKFRLLLKLFLEAGIRHDYASYSGDNLFSPRVSVSYSFSRNTFLRGAWGYYYQTQFMNDLDVNHNITTFDPAELSKHYVLGLDHLFNNGLSLRVEAYYKDISKISSNYENLRDPWEVFPESRNDQARMTYKGASSKGIEFFLKFDQGQKVSWWFSYALANAEEKIVSIEFEGSLITRTGTLPRINNQRHTIYADLNYRPSDKWSLNLSGQYYIGLPQTIYDYDFEQISGINGSMLPLHFYPKHLEFRGLEYPAYHRMDLRANRHFYLKNSKITAFVHLVNLYGRENLRKFDLDVTDDNDNLVPDGQGGYLYPRDDGTWFGFFLYLERFGSFKLI